MLSCQLRTDPGRRCHLRRAVLLRGDLRSWRCPPQLGPRTDCMSSKWVTLGDSWVGFLRETLPLIYRLLFPGHSILVYNEQLYLLLMVVSCHNELIQYFDFLNRKNNRELNPYDRAGRYSRIRMKARRFTTRGVPPHCLLRRTRDQDLAVHQRPGLQICTETAIGCEQGSVGG